MHQDEPYREHESYIRHSVPLMLHHTWRQARDPQNPVPLSHALKYSVDIWRKTVHYDGGLAPSDAEFAHPAWTPIVDALSNLLRQYSNEADSLAFERAGMAFLWPLLEPCIERNSRLLRDKPDRHYGAWTVTFRGATVMSVHIANVYRPHSVFDHPAEFASDLLRLILDTCEARPAVDTLFCGSWLNNRPVFQAFFPPEWVINLHRPIRNNDTEGIWGQYVTRTGGFHTKNAQWLRTRGRHRYPLIHGQCGTTSAIRYLETEGWRHAGRTETDHL